MAGEPEPARRGIGKVEHFDKTTITMYPELGYVPTRSEMVRVASAVIRFVPEEDRADIIKMLFGQPRKHRICQECGGEYPWSHGRRSSICLRCERRRAAEDGGSR